jgi:hypothetical protein
LPSTTLKGVFVVRAGLLVVPIATDPEALVGVRFVNDRPHPLALFDNLLTGMVEVMEPEPCLKERSGFVARVYLGFKLRVEVLRER